MDSQKGSFSEAEVSKIEQTPANEPQSVPEKVKQEPVTDVLSPKPANSPKAGEKAEVENSAMESQQDKKLAQTSDIPRIKEEDKEQQSRTRTNLEILNGLSFSRSLGSRSQRLIGMVQNSVRKRISSSPRFIIKSSMRRMGPRPTRSGLKKIRRGWS